MKNTVRFSIVMPRTLKDRIDVLAHKGLIKRNKWIVRTLTRASRARNQSGGDS